MHKIKNKIFELREKEIHSKLTSLSDAVTVMLVDVARIVKNLSKKVRNWDAIHLVCNIVQHFL